jgi:hypothetical protein
MSGMVNPGGILRVTEFTGSPSWARRQCVRRPAEDDQDRWLSAVKALTR